jgi:(2Fe-2S) ferredoxin
LDETTPTELTDTNGINACGDGPVLTEVRRGAYGEPDFFGWQLK